MEYRPDLNVLESVEVRPHGDINAYTNNIYSYCVLAIIIAENIVRLMEMQAFNAMRINHLLAVVLSLVIGIDLAFVRVNKIRTDNKGLTVHRYFWSSLIRWSDIREVKAKKSLIMGLPSGYDLITRHGRMWLPIPPTTFRPSSLLLGSIWQHLRRAGKEDAIPIPEQLEDLWWNVPESIPAEAKWSNPQTPSWQPLRALLIFKGIFILLCVVFLAFSLNKHIAIPVISITLILLGGLWVFLWLWLYKDRTFAENVQVDDDGIEAKTGFGRQYLRWQDITTAKWTLADAAIELTGRRATVRIPKHNGAAILLLSILRRLRSMDKFGSIEIPEELRKLPRIEA